MSILEVHDLGKVYGTGSSAHMALNGISMSIEDGEFVSIVGPSGCGKTTLMKTVAGLIEPTSGEVTLVGKPVRGVPDGLAVVFQDYSRSLFPWMKVGKNVEFPLATLGLSKAEVDARIRRSLEAVNLGDKLNRYPWELSGGMQQRVAIARALAYRPRVLLMDEPFASVDAQTRSELEDLIRAVHAEFGMTILFVTHDIDESVYLSDRVLVLQRPPGGILADISVDLPAERDQIGTKSMAAFVALRSDVAKRIQDAATTVARAA